MNSPVSCDYNVHAWHVTASCDRKDSVEFLLISEGNGLTFSCTSCSFWAAAAFVWKHFVFLDETKSPSVQGYLYGPIWHVYSNHTILQVGTAFGFSMKL